MVAYQLNFTSLGKKSFAQLDKEVGQRILDKLKWLVQNIESITPIPLSGLFKLRVGDWRAFYEINRRKLIITLHKIGHRKDIYK